jgi:transcriptional regulator with PAS, ATPase and Fis domain
VFIIATVIIIAVITVSACVMIHRKGIIREDNIANLLKKSCIPWGIIPLEKIGQFQKQKFLCSDEFAKIFGEKMIFTEDFVSALEATGNLQVQTGIQNALKNGTQTICDINIKENHYEIVVSLVHDLLTKNTSNTSVRHFSKPSKSGFLKKDTERKSGEYSNEREHSSSLTHPKADIEDFRRMPIDETTLSGGVLLILKNTTEEAKRKLEYSNAIEQINDLLDILNALPFPVWTRQHDGTISFCNVSYAKLLETQPHQVISKQLELIDGPNSMGAKKLHKNVLSMKKLQTIDANKNCKESTKIFRICEDLVHAKYKVTDKHIIVGVATDISTNTREDQCVKDELQLYKNILYAIDSHFCVVNRNSKVVAYSRSFENMLGVDLFNKDIHVGEILEQLREREKLPGDIDFWQLKDLCKQWVEHRNIPFNEMRHMPFGSLFHIFVEKCSEQNVIISIKDITHVLNVESRYKSLYAMWKVVVDQSKDAVLIMEKNHRIQMCSACTESILCTNVSAGLSIKEFLKDFAQKYSLHIWQTNLEDTIELRNPYSTVISIAENVLLCEYLPLPSGWHMLRFSQYPTNSDVNTLFDKKRQEEQCLKIS